MEKYNEKLIDTFSGLLKARFPYLYIPTWEEDRAIDMIKTVVTNPEIIKTPRKVYVWTQTQGFICDDVPLNNKELEQPLKALDYIKNCQEHAIFILKDFHVNFGIKNRQADYAAIRALRDLIPELKGGAARKSVIFLSPTLILPDDMEKEISVFEFPLPTMEEITAKLEEMIVENSIIETILSPEEKERMAKAALGLTLQEAENAFARAMVSGGKLDIEDLPIILDEKNQVIKKTGILEFIKGGLKISDIGGLENLKKWLQKRNNTWLDAAKKYNLPAPKGVLITGVPGCGKSLTAKAMSEIWQLPLLKLDIGKIFSGLVGSSESNMRLAIQTAEAVSPCILWVDEIEKGFGGVAAGGGGDSGTSTRVFGTFLTWMQDKTAPVFVIATANNISSLPPELLRKGRFDEIFFVDLPTKTERKQIFKLHLEKRLTNPELTKSLSTGEPLFDKLADMTEGFVGAEIEQIVISSLYEAFFQQRELLESDLEMVIKNMVPLSVTQKEQIKSLRDWANVRAVSATAKEDLVEYSNAPTPGDDITQSRGGRTIDL